MVFQGYLNCLVFDDNEKLDAFLRSQAFITDKQVYNYEPFRFDNADFSSQSYNRAEVSFLRLRTEQIIHGIENRCKSNKTIFCIVKKDYDRFKFIREHSDNVLIVKSTPEAITSGEELIFKFLKVRGQPALNMNKKQYMNTTWCLGSNGTFRLLG